MRDHICKLQIAPLSLGQLDFSGSLPTTFEQGFDNETCKDEP